MVCDASGSSKSQENGLFFCSVWQGLKMPYETAFRLFRHVGDVTVFFSDWHRQMVPLDCIGVLNTTICKFEIFIYGQVYNKTLDCHWPCLRLFAVVNMQVCAFLQSFKDEFILMHRSPVCQFGYMYSIVQYIRCTFFTLVSIEYQTYLLQLLKFVE